FLGLAREGARRRLQAELVRHLEAEQVRLDLELERVGGQALRVLGQVQQLVGDGAGEVGLAAAGEELPVQAQAPVQIIELAPVAAQIQDLHGEVRAVER